jgi:hypothetical protein
MGGGFNGSKVVPLKDLWDGSHFPVGSERPYYVANIFFDILQAKDWGVWGVHRLATLIFMC